MSIYCSSDEHVVWAYEGSHVRPWESKKIQVQYDISTIPPWIARGDDYNDYNRICPFGRLAFVGPDGYYPVVISVPQAKRMIEVLQKFVDTPKVSIPRTPVA